jgi:elongation factor G
MLKLYKQRLLKAHRETYKKQSGGRGKSGDIVFILSLLDEVDGKAQLDYSLLML